MRILLKILLFPITLALNILLGFSKFVLVFGGGLLGVLSFVLFVFGIIIAIMPMAGFSEAIPAFIIGYLISPYGLPMMGVWIIAHVEYFNDWLKSV